MVAELEFETGIIMYRNGKVKVYVLTEKEMDLALAFLQGLLSADRCRMKPNRAEERLEERSRKAMSSMSIAQLCKSKGYTQAEVARRIGVSRQTVSLWVQGKLVPSLKCLSALAELFGVEVRSIWLPKKGERSNPC